MTYKAKVEFHTANRHYHVGDEVATEDLTMNVRELCLASEVAPDIVKYKVTLKPNGASGEDIIAETEGYYSLPACKFTAPEGKVFKNWATQASGVGAKNVGAKVNIVHDTVFYAIWIDKAPDAKD